MALRDCMFFNQNNSTREFNMASWSGGVETPHADLLRKREQLMVEAQQFFEQNDFEHCFESLRNAYEISIQLKDKEAQKFIKERMQSVDKKQKNDFIEKLTSTFRNGNKGKRSQEEIMEGLTGTIEVVMNGAFVLEEKITHLEERLAMREKLSEAMVEQIGELTSTIKELREAIAKMPAQSSTPSIAPPGMAPPQGMLMGGMPPAPPSMNQAGSQPQGFTPPPGMSPPPIPGVKVQGPPPGCAPPGPPPPGPAPMKAPPGEKRMPEGPQSAQHSLLTEMSGILAKRRKQLEEEL
jgi:uncharacterized coiled-coil protein SlyX